MKNVRKNCNIGEKKNQSQVQLYRTGCQPTPIHGCDPTTARHGDFCLLGFPPGPVRLSLGNLEISNSFKTPILMPSLVWTPDRHSTPESRTPTLKSSSDSSLHVAGLQEHATTPSDYNKQNSTYKSIITSPMLVWYQNIC